MLPQIVLASGSESRATLLRQANLAFRIEVPRIDEEALRLAFKAEGLSPRDQSDALAEQKARKVGARFPADVIIGSDQILALGEEVFAKPATVEEAAVHLSRLSGSTHSLYTAVVVCEGDRPVWRHLTDSRMKVRPLSDAYIRGYLSRNWPAVQSSVGAYRIEEEGIRLFSHIEGDRFSILGLPLLPLLTYLGQRGLIEQ